MKHTSIKLNSPCEFINIEPVNPLISKCQIKVCYVGEEPNRNGSIITKEVAMKMANSLPGSPIIGYYKEEEQDFAQHTKEIVIEDDKIKMTSKTKPYGFVDLNAKVWFQKYLDDGDKEREYLVTEGYIWTGQYPEAQRVIDQGNNQSMELSQNFLNGNWAKDVTGALEFFIINEAVISALCILGENYEPCFEGANITKVEFSLDKDFKAEIDKMIYQLQKIIDEGGANMKEEQIKDQVVPENEFAKEDEEKKKKKDEEENAESEDNKNDEQQPESKDEAEDEKDKKKAKYSLEEIPEYVELKTQFAQLQEDLKVLMAEKEVLMKDCEELKTFKAKIEKTKKEEMIKSFYMLSDADKEDVVKNIDNYSLDEIESKLSVICVRNKVHFFDVIEETKKEPETIFNLEDVQNDPMPAWIKAVEARRGNI